VCGVLELGLQPSGRMSQFEHRPPHIPTGCVVPFLRAADDAAGAWVDPAGLGRAALLKVNAVSSFVLSKGDSSTTTNQH
jgi:hypothetical protein